MTQLKDMAASLPTLQQFLGSHNLTAVEVYFGKRSPEVTAFAVGNMFGTVVSLPKGVAFDGLVTYNTPDLMKFMIADLNKAERYAASSASSCSFLVDAGRGLLQHLISKPVHRYSQLATGWVSEWDSGALDSIFLKRFSGYTFFAESADLPDVTQLLTVVTFMEPANGVARPKVEASLKHTAEFFPKFFADGKKSFRDQNLSGWRTSFQTDCLPNQ